jgi:membrane AbrB-like protein
MLVVLVAAATLASYQILTRYGGWDRVTAMCGAIPGNLSLVVATALEQGAATERVAIAHTLRLLVLLVVVPPAVALVATETVALARPASAGLIDTLILLAGGLAAGAAAHAVRMPGGLLIGAFMASGALHAFGIVETVLPRPIVGGALVLLGTAIGARFAGVSLATFLHVLVASTASLTAGLLVCLVPAAGFALATGLPLAQALLAFAPGGLEAMITLAFVLDSDVPYVAALHMIRVVTLAIALPLLLRFVGSGRPDDRPR